MEYTVVHEPAANIIIASAQGDWEADQDDAMIEEIIEMIKAAKTRKVLLDIQALKNIDLSTLRLYGRAQVLQSRRREPETATVRVAILYTAKDRQSRENFQFFETTARNRGLPYKLFEDKAEAMQWLTTS